MKTLNQQAREIVGHEEGCRSRGPYEEDRIDEGATAGLGIRSGYRASDCTCPPLPLHVRVAAGMGDLERACFNPYADGDCDQCRDPEMAYCAPPLDAARSWRLVVALHGVDLGYHGGRWAAERVWEDASGVETSMSRGADTPEEAVALLFEALCDAGLYPEAVDTERRKA